METGTINCSKHPDQPIRQDQSTGKLYCPKCRANKTRRERHAAYIDCGMCRVRGALGGVSYE